MIAGDIQPDDDTLQVGAGTRISLLAQNLPIAVSGSVFGQVAGGLGEPADLVREYHDLGQRLGAGTDAGLLAPLEAIQHRLETIDG